MNPKLKAIAYWASTILVLLPTAGTGIPELFTHGPAATVQIMHTLGYPLYIMQITGLAKILGAIPILMNRPLRLVEWAMQDLRSCSWAQRPRTHSRAMRHTLQCH